MDKQTEITKMAEKINNVEKTPKKKKSPVYHVACDGITGKIYAGTINKKMDKWLSNTDVTYEALMAVRDHFTKVMEAQEKTTRIVGYQWKTEDEKTITLQLIVNDASMENGDE